MNVNPILIASTIISMTVAIITFLMWRNVKKQSEDFTWNLSYQAFRDFEKEAATKEFMEVHGITEDTLDKYNLSPEKLRIYLLFVNTLWVSTRRKKMYSKIRKTKEYNKKLQLASTDTWDPKTRTGRILRSVEFAEAWELVSQFWSRDDFCTTSPYIEATMAQGIIEQI